MRHDAPIVAHDGVVHVDGDAISCAHAIQLLLRLQAATIEACGQISARHAALAQLKLATALAESQDDDQPHDRH